METLTPSGLLVVDRAIERHPVRPGGVTVVRLSGDDELRIIDRHGGQVAELTAVGAPLGPPADADATVLRETGLALDGANAADARCARLFGPESPPGAELSFTAVGDTTVAIGAPGGRVVDGEQPATELALEVRRATPRAPVDVPPPPPLAEPRLDFRVDAATAASYEVRAGEYIQVIDVRGRQCSDFLAFHAGKLQDGRERGLDATVTRTLTGTAYPRPGLHGTFYDQDLDPLAEVVRDTVGRHDTFALACQARYYEDMGYPGHVNCTDNFNAALREFRIAPRSGWPALNFFYNTAFDGAMQLTFDEPWSRPGDYVLLRAATDLVCASSACPDDIDPANGWEVTDVHIRVYAPQNRFSIAMARRVSADSEPVLTRETGFHSRTSALTKSFVEHHDHWMAQQFTSEGAIAEYWACRERVALIDRSWLRKWEVLGPDAETLLQRALTRDVRRLSVGEVTYTALCNETGGMIDDATLFRLGRDNFRLVGSNDDDGAWLRRIADRLQLKVWIKPSTDQLHNLAVQGPRSRETLGEIVWAPSTQPSLRDLGRFRFLIGRIGDRDGVPIIVSRTGYTGELGYEVWCHPSDGEAVWDAVWEAGQGHGIAPLGLEALDMLRIEAGLIEAGCEFDDQVDPFEAGIGFTVALGDEDFIGREALAERSAHPRRRLVGLELDGGETAGSGDQVQVDGQRVGIVTSATRSPILRRSIALCRIALRYADAGTAVQIGKLDGHQKRLDARVVPLPFRAPAGQ